MEAGHAASIILRNPMDLPVERRMKYLTAAIEAFATEDPAIVPAIEKDFINKFMMRDSERILPRIPTGVRTYVNALMEKYGNHETEEITASESEEAGQSISPLD